MSHQPPETFPDPTQRIGTPMTPPHGTEPNPAYQDLLTLYAKVYGAEAGLAKALHPACKTVSGEHAWIGEAARKWSTELEDWDRRLAHAAGQILHELADRLRATPPYVHIGTRPMEPGGGSYPDPGGPMGLGPDASGPGARP